MAGNPQKNANLDSRDFRGRNLHSIHVTEIAHDLMEADQALKLAERRNADLRASKDIHPHKA